MKEVPFRSTIAGGENFNSDIKTYGLEKSLPPVNRISFLSTRNNQQKSQI